MNSFMIYNRWDKLESEIDNDTKYLDGRFRIEPILFVQKIQIYISSNIDKTRRIFVSIDAKDLDFNFEKIKGLHIYAGSNKNISETGQYVEIACSENHINEAFLSFSASLISNIFDMKDRYPTVYIIDKTLNDYVDFFDKAKNKKMLENLEQGLFAELAFLKNQIDLHGDASIGNWEGPAKYRHDFVFDDCSVEIKSSTNTKLKSISISNEYQLDAGESKLYLYLYIIDKVNTGISIDHQVDEILMMLSSENSKKAFERKLMQYGYIKNDYSGKKYAINKIIKYLVNENFPKIIKSTINHSIFDVRYKISIENLEEEIEIDEERDFFNNK